MSTIGANLAAVLNGIKATVTTAQSDATAAKNDATAAKNDATAAKSEAAAAKTEAAAATAGLADKASQEALDGVKNTADTAASDLATIRDALSAML